MLAHDQENTAKQEKADGKSNLNTHDQEVGKKRKKKEEKIFVAVGGDGSRSTVRLTSCGTPCNPAGCDASASKSNASTKHDRSSYIPSPRLLTFLNRFFFFT